MAPGQIFGDIIPKLKLSPSHLAQREGFEGRENGAIPVSDLGKMIKISGFVHMMIKIAREPVRRPAKVSEIIGYSLMNVNSSSDIGPTLIPAELVLVHSVFNGKFEIPVVLFL